MNIRLLFVFTCCVLCFFELQSQEKYHVVIHGGAGLINENKMPEKLKQQYKKSVERALEEAYKLLRDSVNAISIAVEVIKILEDDSLFNAGRGAVLNSEGNASLDASIMDGKTLEAGAVAGVSNVKNPIALAKVVLQKSQHVLLSGDGAELFAKSNGLEMVLPSYFITHKRKEQLKRMKAHESNEQGFIPQKKNFDEQKFGTVGAVVLDLEGNLAAATSTGGMMNKKYGRVGDSPIIGAGTYADNSHAAISCTGHGEYFMRLLVAYDVIALMKYKGLELEEAANNVINTKLTDLGGSGGLIGIDKNGNIAMPFNTSAMFRGTLNSKGDKVVKIFKD